MTEHDRHLSITDMPLSAYGAHEQEMLKRANRQGELALRAVGEGEFKQASGYFQACLALYQEAIILTRANLQTAARLAALQDARTRETAESLEPALGWPIPSLVNFSARSDEESPRWGVVVPERGSATILSIVPGAEEETMQLHVEPREHPGQYLVFTLTRRHWDALDKLAQRVLSGADIPDDTTEQP